jgi:hypothetical protein
MTDFEDNVDPGSSDDVDASQPVVEMPDWGCLSPKQTASVSVDELATDELTGLPVNSGALWPPLQFKKPESALPFPVEVFPAALQAYCREVADAMLAPVDFVGASMLTVAGAAIGQSFNIGVKRNWKEPPLLFMILVAPPGKTKSPVIREVVGPLTKADDRLREESTDARVQWDETKNYVKKRPAAQTDESETSSDEVLPGPPIAHREPAQRRAIVKDITRESLVIILADNPRGVLCDPDEASGWVASFNEYKGKGGADRQFWLSIWSCTSVSVDRKGGREARHVTTPFVAVLGGLPPDMLNSLKDERGRDDGFIDRVLFVYPEKFPSQHWNEVEISDQATLDWSGAIDALLQMPMRTEDDLQCPHRVEFTSDAKAIWMKWWDSHADETEGTEFSGRLGGAWSKLRAHAARFALILSRLRWSCDPHRISATMMEPDEPLEMTVAREHAPADVWESQFGIHGQSEVSADDVVGAIKLVDYFKSHLFRVSYQMVSGIGNPDAQDILDWIKSKGLTSFRQADIGSDRRRFRSNPRLLTAALRFLKEVGAIRPSPETATGSRRGPKPTPSYDVHPELLMAPAITGNTGNYPRPGQDHEMSGDHCLSEDAQLFSDRELYEL